MHRKITWAIGAAENFNLNLDYLIQEWGLNTSTRFVDRIGQVRRIIQSNPFIYQGYNAVERVHRAVINKRVISYYKILDDGNIDLVTFWNTRKDPTSIRF
jgi:hypothetical protein